MINRGIVPALMFHSVGLESHPWTWSYISEPLRTFEAKIALLKRNGFTSICWNDLYEYMAGRRQLPENSILLTFDDGYLDNWVFVYPVMKKFGMRGTIFVNPEFVDPREELRPNLEDVEARRCSRDELSVAGFLSWAEMREMERSGIMDIQSHAMSHTWYFGGPRIVEFHRPYDVTPHPWLFWNAKPDRKPYYLTENQQEHLPWGFPILEHGKALVVRRFYPSERQVDDIVQYVNDNGGRTFFEKNGWYETLKRSLGRILDGDRLDGHYESDEDRLARVTYELGASKTLIEQNLRKRVDFICWPGGASDMLVHKIALDLGYKAWTLGSSSKVEKRNLPGRDPLTIKRIGTSNEIIVRGRRCGTARARYQLWTILQHQGSMIHSALLKGCKVGYWVWSLLGMNR